MSQHFFSEAQPADILEGLLDADTTPRTQREQAQRIFDLVRGFDTADIGTQVHDRFLEQFYYELNVFTALRDATLGAEEEQEVRERVIRPMPITMLPLRKPDTNRLLFSQTCGSGRLLFPSAVERSYIESVNGRCNICAREYNDHSTIHELDNGNLVSVLYTCKHVFHFDCLLQWFKYKNTCPLCRTACF